MKTIKTILIIYLLNLGGGVTLHAQTFTSFGVNEGLSIPYINNIAVDKKGNKWLGASNLGVFKYNDTTFTRITRAQGLPSDTILSITADENGNVWFGTLIHGIAKFDGQNWTYYDSTNGFNHKNTENMFIDQHNTLWTGDIYFGVTRFNSQSFTQYTSPDLVDLYIRGVYVDENDFLWVAHSRGIQAYDGTKWYWVNKLDGLAGDNSVAITGDGKGTYWIAQSFTISKLANKVFRNYDSFDGVPQGGIRSLLVDRSGNPWITSYGGGVAVLDGNAFKRFTTDDGLPHNQVLCSTLDNNGNIWVGTNGGGICKISGYKATGVNEVNTEHKLTVFPNPVTDKINIDQPLLGAKYVISDLNGREVLSGLMSKDAINVTSLDKGLYIMRIIENDVWFTTKFVKQ